LCWIYIGAYYHGVDAVLFVYDITSKQTYQELTNWLDEAQMHAPKSAVQFIVGNKRDLQDSREVLESDAQVSCFPKQKTQVNSL